MCATGCELREETLRSSSPSAWIASSPESPLNNGREAATMTGTNLARVSPSTKQPINTLYHKLQCKEFTFCILIGSLTHFKCVGVFSDFSCIQSSDHTLILYRKAGCVEGSCKRLIKAGTEVHEKLHAKLQGSKIILKAFFTRSLRYGVNRGDGGNTTIGRGIP